MLVNWIQMCNISAIIYNEAVTVDWYVFVTKNKWDLVVPLVASDVALFLAVPVYASISIEVNSIDK